MATHCLLRLHFEAMLICCLSVATSFGATAEPGRIVIPARSAAQTTSAGLQKLSSGLLYIPTAHAEPLPLLILLHKAGGSASEWFSGAGSYAHYADQGHFIILAPESPGQSWGTGPKNWGYDYVAINRALEESFARCAIDRNRLAIGGFSDSASYALSLGLTNGDVFRYIMRCHRVISLGLTRAEDQDRKAWKYRCCISPTAQEITSCRLARLAASS